MDADRLRNIPLLAGLDEAALDRVAGLFRETEILAGSAMAKEGDFAYKFFIVLDGELEVQRHFEHVATLGAGEYFGEMALIEDKRRNARVLALTRCHLAWVMPWDFDTIREEFPEIAARLEATANARLAQIPPE